MSRVEDDREAAKAAERLLQQRRAEESKKTQRATQDNAFSKLVSTAKNEQVAQQGKFAQTAAQQAQAKGKSAIAQLLTQAGEAASKEKAGEEMSAAGRGDEARATTKQGATTLDERVKQYAQGTERQVEGVKQSDHTADQAMELEHAADSGSASAMASSRGGDAKSYNTKLDQRHSDSTDAAKKGGPSPGGARAEKGDLKADTDKGGGGGGSKDNKGGDPAAGAANFRFNPALMAPVPVAKANPAAGSDRLRRIATEIAQKIVEKVRVGTNAAGKMEFQIDFRNDVLSGLSVKVSAKNGKISAVFSGRDRDVLKMLEEQSEGLKSALTARGLSLEDFKVEAKA